MGESPKSRWLFFIATTAVTAMLALNAYYSKLGNDKTEKVNDVLIETVKEVVEIKITSEENDVFILYRLDEHDSILKRHQNAIDYLKEKD